MSRPTSYYATLVPTGEVINDRLFLTLNNGGATPENPALLGLGATIIVDVNPQTRDVRAKLRRITDLGPTDERDITGNLVQVTPTRFSIEGGLGGDIIGFPNVPTLDYSLPQLFEIEFTAIGKTRRLVQTYQFWVQEGHLHSLQSCNSVAVAGEVICVLTDDLILDVNAIATAFGSCGCACIVDPILTDDASFIICASDLTPGGLYDLIFDCNFLRNYTEINIIDPQLAQCLFDEYQNAKYYGLPNCWLDELGTGLTLAFFQAICIKNDVLGLPKNDFPDRSVVIPGVTEWIEIANNLTNIYLFGGTCTCTCTFEANAIADAAASVFGTVTVTCGAQVFELSILLSGTDQDTAQAVGVGP